MRPARFLCLAFSILIFAFSTSSYGAVPQMISYQAKLTTPAGALVDTIAQMTFAIYDSSTGGNILWTEIHDSVAVEKGIYSVLLGSVNPLPDSVFNGEVRYLGVQVESDQEMIPRKTIASVAYAFRAGISDGGGGSCGWVDDNGVVRLENSTDSVGIGTTNPQAKVHVNGGVFVSDLYANAFHVDSAGGDGIHVEKVGGWAGYFDGSGYFSGNVGIGTMSPIEKLHVNGTTRVTGFEMPTGATDGYVLTSDATGVGTWQTAAAVGGGWADDGTIVRLVTTTDSIGIGTTSPTEKLEVSGNIKASGTITSGSSITLDGANDKITATSGTIDFDDENLQTIGIIDIGGFEMPTGATNGYVLTSDALGVGTWKAAVGGADNDWTFRITDTADTTLMTSGEWGISRHGNVLYGSYDSTHVNLGIACTTGSNGAHEKYCTVAGGVVNTATREYSTVAGGYRNIASYMGATVGGGSFNTASSPYSVVGGGIENSASGVRTTVGGGNFNTASGDTATVGGGSYNTANAYLATVGGGWNNTASGYAATVGGGRDNTAGWDTSATVAGGQHNVAGSYCGSVGGGIYNAVWGNAATIPGGWADTVYGSYSFAAGARVRIAPGASYTFAFGHNFTTSTPYAAVFHSSSAPIKVGIQTTAPDEELHVVGNIKMVDGNQAAGKVLTSDANGVGSWQAGSGDNDWTFRITDTADTTLMTGGSWGIARYGNTLYSNCDSTHINLGVACTTGSSGGAEKYCTVGGGYGNSAISWATTVGGGDNNKAIFLWTTVGGGRNNTANSGMYATIGGGEDNITNGRSATVGGGSYNTVSRDYATVGGGYKNSASGYAATVPGGYADTAAGKYSTVGGGWGNTASDSGATVGGGYGNKADTSYTVVGGGFINLASGYAATVPGGYADTAAGDYSFAAGDSVRITSAGDYTFAFGRDFTTATPNAVIFHNSVNPIKVGVGTTSPNDRLEVNGAIRFGTDTFVIGQARAFTTGVSGLVITGEAGSSTDFDIGESGGYSIMQNPAGTHDLALVIGGGDVGVGTTTPTGKMDVNGDDIRIRSSQTPASSSAAGYTGEIAWDSNYIYICVSGDGPGGGTDTWKRAALSTW